jgi:tight adherence protein C
VNSLNAASGILFIAEVTTFMILHMIARTQYGDFVAKHKAMLMIGVTGCIGLWTADAWKPAQRLPEAVSKLHAVTTALYGKSHAIIRTKLMLADMIGLTAVSVVLVTGLAAVANDASILAAGLPLSSCMPWILYKDAEGKLKRHKRAMLLELPELLNQLTLLVGAGATIQQALLRCLEGSGRSSKHGPAPDAASPLRVELEKLRHDLLNHAPFGKAMEEFSKRCGLQEVSMFTTTVLLNYKRGGDDLTLALKELSIALWEKRKSIARTIGEEASSKLVFPMVIIFLVVMIIVAAPALFMMES